MRPLVQQQVPLVIVIVLGVNPDTIAAKISVLKRGQIRRQQPNAGKKFPIPDQTANQLPRLVTARMDIEVIAPLRIGAVKIFN